MTAYPADVFIILVSSLQQYLEGIECTLHMVMLIADFLDLV